MFLSLHLPGTCAVFILQAFRRFKIGERIHKLSYVNLNIINGHLVGLSSHENDQILLIELFVVKVLLPSE